MSIDVIGNFLTSIRNGLKASKPSVEVPHSNLKVEMARILKGEGFIRDYAVVQTDVSAVKKLHITLKYKDGESVIHDIQRVSTPGRRFYAGSDAIRVVIGGLGLSIVTTSQGVISHKEARKRRVGGEILCTVW